MKIATEQDLLSDEYFIFCLETVEDVEEDLVTEAYKSLEELSNKGIPSIYKTCDSIEDLENSLDSLLYDDHNFQNYEIIYLVMEGEENKIFINNYHYSLEEIAGLFEGKMRGKIIHFSNKKTLDLSVEESQYFLNITGAKAISGYGTAFNNLPSYKLDQIFFSLCEGENDITQVVKDLYRKYYTASNLLDFRLYY